MKYYINGISSYSKLNFNQLGIDYFEDDATDLITCLPEKYTAVKGLRHVPRTTKLLHVSLVNLIETYDLQNKAADIGLYNISHICSLEPHIEFDNELDKYGAQLANPILASYKLLGVHTGWMALKGSMTNINLSINSGRCSLLTAMKSCILDIMEKNICYGIITGGHFMGDPYKNINTDSNIKKEVTYSFLVSREKKSNSIVEITEVRIFQFNIDLFEKLLKEFSNKNIVIDSDDSHLYNYTEKQSLIFIKNMSSQTSLFPFYINSFVNRDCTCNTEFVYIIIDKRGIMGYIKFIII